MAIRTPQNGGQPGGEWKHLKGLPDETVTPVPKGRRRAIDKRRESRSEEFGTGVSQRADEPSDEAK